MSAKPSILPLPMPSVDSSIQAEGVETICGQGGDEYNEGYSEWT